MKSLVRYRMDMFIVAGIVAAVVAGWAWGYQAKGSHYRVVKTAVVVAPKVVSYADAVKAFGAPSAEQASASVKLPSGLTCAGWAGKSIIVCGK